MKGNYNILSEEELKAFDDKYYFILKDEFIVVCNKGCNKQTAHLRNDSFTLILSNKKSYIKITPKAVDLWESNFKDTYTLFAVQNAMNTLVVLCQNPDVEDVKKQLSRKTNKIETIQK